MPSARYFVPDHPKLTDVYTRDELRVLLQKGELSRSDMICDDETGLAHLLGDFLSTPYPQATTVPTRSTDSSVAAPFPTSHEFRASTPLSQPETPLDDDWENEELEEEEAYDEDALDDDHADGASNDNPSRLLNESEESENDDDDLIDEDASFEEESAAAYQPITTLLAEDEEILYEGHPSWFAYPKTLFGFVLFALAAAFCWRQHYGLEWLTMFGSTAGLFLLYIGLERTTTSYFVSPRRVEMEFGIIGRSTKEVRIGDIRAIDVKQSGLFAVLGLGTVSFDSSAGAAPEVVFKNVRGPHQIKDLVRRLQG